MAIYKDEDLIRQMQSESPAERNKALSTIYQSNYSMVAYFVKKNNGTDEDAADIFQDSLIAMYNKAAANNLQLTASLSTYIYSIARNLWYKKLRSRNRNIPLEDTHEKIPLDGHFFNDLLRSERDEAVADKLNLIGEDCRKVLRYFYYDRLRMKDIMALMGWQSTQVAKNKKSSCMKKLRAIIMDDEGFLEFIK